MTSILDSSTDSAKILLIGETGAGKTGAQASLVCAGYRLRIADTDKGIKTLRGLLTHPGFPYAKIIKDRKINLEEAVDFQPVSNPMGFTTVIHKIGDKNIRERLLAPKSAGAWEKLMELLENWPGAGHIDDWEPDVVFSLDALDAAARYAYYHIQFLNNRLGAREEGYDFQRDTGQAQGQIRRLLEMLSNDTIKCNMVIISHIRRADLTAGYAQSPAERARQDKPIDARGYPSVIGVALSPHVGEKFNDTFVVEASGSGGSVRRTINTVPVSNTAAKASTFLKDSYPVSSGLAEIFAELRGSPIDPDLVTQMRAQRSGSTPTPSGLNLPS